MTHCAGNVFPFLAQKTTSNVAEVVWWAVALILLVLALGVAVIFAKHRLFGKKKDEPAPPTYTLHQIRKMLKNGEISQQEFEKLKEIVNTQTRKTGPLNG